LILLLAVVAGLIAGLARAAYHRTSLQIPDLRFWWVAVLAVTPQLLAFHLPFTRDHFPFEMIRIALVSSQLLLMIFAILNLDRHGFWALGLGLLLNLVVIGSNGGLMPISPETVKKLAPNTPGNSWQIGERLGTTKDIVLPSEKMNLGWLSDRFLFPDWLPYHVAFSLGDIFVAIGAFWFLWSLGKPPVDIRTEGD
jgi:hypothetical protein